MISPAGLQMIKTLEGLRLEAYQDQGGRWTIGYGETEGVHEGMTCTEVWATAKLLKRCCDLEVAIYKLVQVPMSAGKMAALISFCYNLGLSRLAGSTLLKLLNQNQPTLAAQEFPKWNKVGGIPSIALRNRRMIEQAMFLASPPAPKSE